MGRLRDALRRSEEGRDKLYEGIEDEIATVWKEQPWLEAIARGINLRAHYEEREPIWLEILEQLYKIKKIDSKTYRVMRTVSL